MAYGFRLTAKKDITVKGTGKVLIAKGMSFEHVEKSCSAPQPNNVLATIEPRFGGECYLPSVSGSFDITKL